MKLVIIEWYGVLHFFRVHLGNGHVKNLPNINLVIKRRRCISLDSISIEEFGHFLNKFLGLLYAVTRVHLLVELVAIWGLLVLVPSFLHHLL